jgi:putative membrane protein
LLAGDTRFGGEGAIRYIYFFILITHIFLAAIILPFILFTAYRSLTGEFEKHKKLARYTWPLWLYVSVTGVWVYILISPYYA